jgi:hypothetical protein
MYDNDYEVTTPNNPTPPPVRAMGASATIMESKGMQEARTEIQMAKMFPRDMADVNMIVSEEFENFALANKAMYKYKRGTSEITGLSIRAAEGLARAYGNMNFGFKILEQDEDHTTVVAFSWDKQRNVRVEREMRISHTIKLRDGAMKKKEDPRDLLEHVTSWAQRGVRSTILEVIPKGLQDRAEQIIHRTMKNGPANIPHAEQVNHLVVAFSKLGVPKDYLEKRLGHPIAATTPDEKVDLIGIFNSLKDKQAKVSDFFGADEITVTTKEDIERGNMAYDAIVKLANELMSGLPATAKADFLQKYVGTAKLDDLKKKKADALEAILADLKTIPKAPPKKETEDDIVNRLKGEQK